MRFRKAVSFGIASLAAGLCASAVAATATYDFSTDPASDPDFIISSNNPDPWKSTGGNTGGYYAITESVNSQYSQLLFPDFDNGLVVKAFSFECDLRIGNAIGNDGRPADGFSINYARASDPQVQLLINNGSAAGSDFYAASGASETGTTTGIAISFDTWSGNALPDGPDIEGIIVRVDNKTITRVSLPVRNGACDDVNSLQTGPWDGVAGSDAGTGIPDNLCWQKFKVDLAENGELTVTYKSRVLLDKFATGFIPGAGRLLFAGRTGSANENHHVDNVKITTVPAEKVLFTGVKGNPLGCAITLDDAGPSVLDPASVVFKFDDAVIPAAQLSLSKTGGTTTIVYTSTTRLAAGSTHKVDVEFKDTRGVSGTGAASFTVGAYALIPASFADSGVNKNQPGFLMRPYATDVNNPNTLQWTEEQLAGKYGPNLADLSGAGANGYYVRETVINFDVAAGIGNFITPDFPDDPFPGFPGSQILDSGTGNATEEVLTYLEFPAAGVYEMGVNSDDGFRVTCAKNPRDKLGIICGQFDGGRGSSDTLFTLVIEQPGIYPFRLLWQNGNGGCNLEWFTVRNGQKILINDSANPNAIKAYRSSSSAPAYVSSASPIQSSSGIAADAGIKVEVTRGAAPIDSASIQMTMNGAPVIPMVLTMGNVTTIESPSTSLLPAGSLQNLTLSFKDTASPANQNDYAWQFTVANYVTLPSALRSPPGSEDTSKPGINVKTWQLESRTAGGAPTQANNIEWAEGVLAGLVGPNTADLSKFTAGVFAETATVNYSIAEGDANGNFTPDRAHPGIPGTASATATAATDNYASEFVAYIPFAAPGFYTMGVNSDDNFRVTIGEQVGRQYIEVMAPSAIAGGMAAVVTAVPMNVNPGFGGPIPPSPIVADAVVLGTSCLADPALPDLTGKIAVIPRGTCTFVEKCRNAQAKGAIAVVIANNAANEQNFPIVMGGEGPDVTIPVMMVDFDDGQRLINNANGLRLSIGKDTNVQLGEFNGNGRGAADTLFSFYVPQSGVYPFRCFYMQGGGGGNVEWFTVLKDGSKVLVNDTANGALKSYRARTFSPQPDVPTISFALQDGKMVITFTGSLQAADNVTGPWQDVNTSSPYSTALSGERKFYRSKN